MKNELNENSLGLVLGIFMSLIHLVWSIMVALGIAQVFMDWIFGLHMIRPPYQIMPFNALTALGLVVVTFISGYIFGWVFAAVWNLLMKKK